MVSHGSWKFRLIMPEVFQCLFPAAAEIFPKNPTYKDKIR